MSTGWWWAIGLGYLIMGVGVARYVLARRARSYRFSQGDSPEIVLPTVAAFLLWPVALVVCLLLIPIGTVVGPLFAKWFLKPYRKVRADPWES